MRAIGALAIAVLVAGCGVLPQPPNPLDALSVIFPGLRPVPAPS